MDARLYDGGARVPNAVAGPVVGLVALGGGLAAAEVVVGVVAGAPSPVVAVGHAVIDGVPAALKDWAIATFGTSNKVVLVGGVLLVLAALGSAVGWMSVRGHRAWAIGVSLAVGLLGVAAVFARPVASWTWVAPTVVGTAVTVGLLAWLSRRAVVPLGPAGGGVQVDRADGADATAETSIASISPIAPISAGVDRRRFLERVGGVTAASLVLAGSGRMLQGGTAVGGEREVLVLPRPGSPAGSLPSDVDVGIDGVTSFVTPNDRFFRIDTALTVPQVSQADWSLRIHGMVDRELYLEFDDLMRREHVERYITLACVSNEVGGSLVGTARWQGVLLGDLLREAGVDPSADQLVSRSIDGWTCGTPTAVVMDGRDAMLAVGMNGEALPAQHGYPVRMVVPGLFGYVSATKWVTDIELTTWDAYDAYWIRRGWAKEGPIKTLTRIDRPLRVGGWAPGPIDVAGVAWAVHRGISAVQVRVDEGPWHEAELGGVPSVDTWRQWRWRWDATPGVHVLEARAFDGEGVPQPAEPRSVAPDGAQGYHRARVVVDPA